MDKLTRAKAIAAEAVERVRDRAAYNADNKYAQEYRDAEAREIGARVVVAEAQRHQVRELVLIGTVIRGKARLREFR